MEYSKREAGMFEKTSAQTFLTPDATSCFCNLLAQYSQVISSEVGQVCSREMSPHILHWIQLRGVGGEALHVQPMPLLSYKGSGLITAMRGQAVPEQNHATANVPPERPEEVLDRGTVYGAGAYREEQPNFTAVGSGGQCAYQGKPFPVERLTQRRRLPLWRPGSADAGSL